MLRFLLTAIATSTLGLAAASQEEVERLPGQGELKDDTAVSVEGLGRLIPGGGLLLSFDSNIDGVITAAELDAGISAAFGNADANSNGRITPLEQRRWSESLPTRDVSLSNPARFDPNLDRSVHSDEFREIIQLFAANHMDPATSSIPVIALKADKQDTLSPDNLARQAQEEARRVPPNTPNPRTQRRRGS